MLNPAVAEVSGWKTVLLATPAKVCPGRTERVAELCGRRKAAAHPAPHPLRASLSHLSICEGRMKVFWSEEQRDPAAGVHQHSDRKVWTCSSTQRPLLLVGKNRKTWILQKLLSENCRGCMEGRR